MGRGVHISRMAVVLGPKTLAYLQSQNGVSRVFTNQADNTPSAKRREAFSEWQGCAAFYEEPRVKRISASCAYVLACG